MGVEAVGVRGPRWLPRVHGGHGRRHAEDLRDRARPPRDARLHWGSHGRVPDWVRRGRSVGFLARDARELQPDTVLSAAMCSSALCSACMMARYLGHRVSASRAYPAGTVRFDRTTSRSTAGIPPRLLQFYNCIGGVSVFSTFMGCLQFRLRLGRSTLGAWHSPLSFRTAPSWGSRGP